MIVKRFGIVGKRGLSALAGLRSVEGVEVTAFAELSEAERLRAQAEHGIPFACSEWTDLLELVDAVVVATPMPDHAAQSIAALQARKSVLCEVPVAVTLDECQALTQEIQKAKGVFMMAENYCFFRENLIVCEMAARGLFGEPYYAEGEYVHEVRSLHRDPRGNPTWRMKWQVGIRGNTYITHELGPVMQWFRAYDPSLRIESVACFGSGTHTDPELNHDDTSLTLVQLSNGGLIKIRLDMVSNRPEKVAYGFQGTRGAYESEGGHRVWIEGGRSQRRLWQPLASYADLLGQELREELDLAATHGHSGGDFITGRRFAQAIIGERDPAVTTFDSLEWTIAGLLSQQSILQGSAALPMPKLV